jgi:hypothetical protein
VLKQEAFTLTTGQCLKWGFFNSNDCFGVESHNVEALRMKIVSTTSEQAIGA